VNRFERKALPERFCNLERLLAAMTARGLDGIVVSTPLNVFYLSGFNGIAHKADEPRPYALLLSRHAPDHPILVLADYYLATFLVQPSWVRDIRPFRAVMMPLDRTPQREDIDRFIPSGTNEISWLRAARNHYAFDMSSALRGALAELGLERGRIGFDDLALGQRLGLEHTGVADAYDALMFARAVKTPTEIDLLRRATALNRAAIERTVKSWEKGMRWRELNRAYHAAAVDLGGFVRDPGAMVGPSTWSRRHAHATDRPGGLRGGTRPACDVRLPRHARPLLLGRRQDVGGGRRAAGRGKAQPARHGTGRRTTHF
jgi:Xaa-Pro aminopeptidase